MGSELIESFDSLNQILQNTVSGGQIHVFDEIRNHYVEEPFVYTEPMPRYIAPVLQPVPQKSWLEKVFKSKEQARKNIIAANETTENEAKVHTAVASGRWCGVQWPQCGLSGHHESAH